LTGYPDTAPTPKAGAARAILLPMQPDPAEEFRRLAEEYRGRSDDELREVAADFSDLTGTAQQVLRQEMRSRGLGDPAAANTAAQAANAAPRLESPLSPAAHSDSQPARAPADLLFGDSYRSPKLVPDETDGGDHDAASDERDFTWKTVLCECDTNEQAQGLSEALRQAGLDNWVQASREFGRRFARVLVAADQLDQARAIAAQPIAPEIVAESKEEIPEFVEPKCPKCGSDDVVLDGVDAENHWRCEQCSAAWSDPA